MEVRTSLAEQFLNWYIYNTTMYFRKNKKTEGDMMARLIEEFNQLKPFFDPIDRKITDLEVLAWIGKLAVDSDLNPSSEHYAELRARVSKYRDVVL